jgi:hypothetical protein
LNFKGESYEKNRLEFKTGVTGNGRGWYNNRDTGKGGDNESEKN